MCGAFERKEMISQNWKKKNIYTYDTAIKMVNFTTEA